MARQQEPHLTLIRGGLVEEPPRSSGSPVASADEDPIAYLTRRLEELPPGPGAVLIAAVLAAVAAVS